MTAYDHYAREAFEVSAVDYLVKPFDERRFRAMLIRVRQRYTAQSVSEREAALATLIVQLERASKTVAETRPRLLADAGGHRHMIDVAQIEMVEADRNYVTLHIDSNTFHARTTLQQAEEAMRLLLARDPRPDGVFCFNDPLAIGAMSTILEAGLRIPEDIALIGCGNLPNNNCLRVPLSSIDQHSQMIGQRAAELVLSLIESKQKPRARTIVLEPTLVVRSSTQRKERRFAGNH